MIPIMTLLIVLFVSMLLTRIATVALTHTGLSRESAKFQARSAFTGVVTVVSALIVSFIKLERADALFWQIFLLVSGLVLLRW